MKYVITGGAGNISKPIVLQLLKKGHDVSVVGRDEAHLKELVAAGAKPLIGSIEDPAFLTRAFAEADVVYTMVPPIWDTGDWKGYIGQIGENYATAIKAGGVKYVVNLSSIGGHLAEGAGPISGLHRVENALNALKNVNIIHLRPGYFYTNLLSNISMIKAMNIVGNNTGSEAAKLAMADTDDIATVAIEILDSLDFTGHSVKYIASDEPTNGDTARILGAAVGKPDVSWVEFSNEQALQGMIGAGLPEEIAKNYTEMGEAMKKGTMFEDYWKNHPQSLGKTKLKDFAKVFAKEYEKV
jgi:uncharacterized protein YbjT (DUF2867 family)